MGVFVNEVRLAVSADEDLQRPGGVVTVELCGSWEHDGPCAVPHRTDVTSDGEATVVRTVFVATAAEAPSVLDRLGRALSADPGWRVLSNGASPPTADEGRLGARLASAPGS